MLNLMPSLAWYDKMELTWHETWGFSICSCHSTTFFITPPRHPFLHTHVARLHHEESPLRSCINCFSNFSTRRRQRRPPSKALSLTVPLEGRQQNSETNYLHNFSTNDLLMDLLMTINGIENYPIMDALQVAAGHFRVPMNHEFTIPSTLLPYVLKQAFFVWKN